MKNKQRGFTLIELLVVVLIIGILAAVALPQYTKAVDKAKVGRLLPMLRAAGNAVDRYYMANNELPTSWGDLDLDFSAGYYCGPGVHDGTGDKSSYYTTPARNGCDKPFLFSKDGYLRLESNGVVQVAPYLKGEGIGTSNARIDIRFAFYPVSIYLANGGTGNTARGGKMVCVGTSDYGQKLCSTFGKEDSVLSEGFANSYWF